MEFLRPSETPADAVEQLRAWLAAETPAHLLIETSGSTGAPKKVLLTRDAVLASVHASAAHLSGAGGRWALVLPSSYVAGVQVIVRSLVAGHDPVLGAFADDAGPAAYTSLVPTQLHRALEDPEQVRALAAMQTVLVGGGAMDAGLRERAEAAGIHVVATYGASETAGGCIYDGHPLDGVAVAIDAAGRVRLGGPTIFTGYLDDPELTAATLVDGWYVTSDLGTLDHDGRLKILGRADDVVVSGGVNVPLPAVRTALLGHTGVDQVEVVGVPNDEWGTEVVAVLVPTPGTSPTLDALRDTVARERPRAWAPRRIVVVDALPLLGNGKVDRHALRALAAHGTQDVADGRDAQA